MRGLVVLAFALAACGGMAAQTPVPAPADTPTQRPSFTPAQFQITPTPPPPSTATPSPSARPSPTGPAAPVVYVAMGASDTVGVGAADPLTGAWPAQIAARLPGGSSYLNLGVSGSLAAQAGREQGPKAVAARPDVVTVWLAVNDLNARVDADLYRLQLGSLIDALVRGTQAFVFVGTVPDLRTVPAYAGQDPSGLLTRITAYNAQLDTLAKAYFGRVFLVDLFTGSAALVTGGTVSGDGFHPSAAGYRQIADRFAAAMRDRGVQLSP